MLVTNSTACATAALLHTHTQDYARQTVTLEAHPHLESHQASVHPCKHSAVMRRIVENLTAGGKQSSARVDQYLFVFLKFIQSVCPTIDYDYTMEIDAMS
jgi:ubiquitin-like-conjugating enzyme ATG3